ncbi:hypothetical protein ACMBCM_08050 [Spiroplasma sp. K1]
MNYRPNIYITNLAQILFKVWITFKFHIYIYIYIYIYIFEYDILLSYNLLYYLNSNTNLS